MADAPDETLRFGWEEARERASAWAKKFAVQPATAGARFAALDPATGDRLELELPLVLGRPAEGTSLRDWAQAAPAAPGAHLVVLVQAGAVSAGFWRHDELLAHKAWKRYVVRGRGKAQPTHLKTKGKSRFGSRLRLRNAELLREELGARVTLWWHEHGPPVRIFVSCPVREWPELFRAAPDLPFGPRDERIERVPLDVHVPDHAELLRVRGFLGRGRLRRWRATT